MSAREAVVFDTNVLVSFALWRDSTPWRAVELALRFDTIAVSPATFREFVRTLLYPKFDRYATQTARLEVIRRLGRAASFYRPVERIAQSRDPQDDKFLELAVAAQSSIVVSGDKDLLVLGRFRRIDIMTPAQFLAYRSATDPASR